MCSRCFQNCFKRGIQKTAEATSDLIRNKVTAKTKKNSKNIETVTNQNDKEISKEKYISSKKTENYSWTKINI